MNNEIYEEFTHWLDDLLENADIPENASAWCFNLYEESVEDSVYAAQLIAADEFDENDDEWACSEVWSSEENIFCIELSDEPEKDWKSALKIFSGMAEEYIGEGKYADILASRPIGIGFVDGDLEILKNNER